MKNSIIHKNRLFKNNIIQTKKIEKQNKVKEATGFQLWFARMGGLIESEDFEKVLEKFNHKN